MDTKTFFCSRTERGATACSEQCDSCRARKTVELHTIGEKEPKHVPIEPSNADQDKAREVLQQRSEENAKAAQQGPALVASLTVNLYDDGNLQVNGPFNDRILFGGLLRMADIVERDMAHRTEQEARRRADLLAKEPWIKRKLRERAERKAREKAHEAQALAAALSNATVEHNDELTKSLAENAKKPN